MVQIKPDWLTNSATQSVFALLKDHQVFAVGGCVRNALLGEPVHDIDMATSALPETVLALAKTAGLRAIPTGIDHGTLTVIAEDTAFEITTFRKDVETDGRRAVVAFSTDIEDDARRRDFTMNALYADASGHILDPVQGVADIETRTVRFIDNANDRIREDYLRSLRFFRFCAFYVPPENGFETEALDAIARNLPGLVTLSRERVGSELKRLLEAPNPAPAVAAMRATGVLATVLPGADDTSLGPLVALEEQSGAPPDSLRRFAILGGDTDTLRLSRKETDTLAALKNAAGQTPRHLGYKLGAARGLDAALITAASLGQPLDLQTKTTIENASNQTFPVVAADLMPAYQGKALGDRLRQLETQWIDSAFTLSKTDLLAKG